MAGETPDFVIKRNDYGSLQPFRAKLEKLKVNPETGEPELEEGKEVFVPVELTGTTVRLALESRSTIEGEIRRIKTGEATGLDGEALDDTGWIEYLFEKSEGEEPSDLSFAGDFDMEFEITTAGGASVATVPNEGYYYLKIEADKGPVA